MITLVTGKPGSGKSFYTVKKSRDVLVGGRWLAGNMEFTDGWELAFARSNPVWRAFGRKYCERAAAKMRARTYLTHSLDELTRLRLPPCGRCDACRAGRQCRKEGRGVMVLDEAHNWLNARTWDADESGASLSKAEAIANRLKIVRFFSQHRKLGWDVYLITQDAAQLDTQVRRNFEFQTHLKNMRRLRIPILGVPIFPVNLFVAITVWHDAQASRVGTESYFLNKRLARCYSTTATSHGLDWNAPDAIWLGTEAPAARRSQRSAVYSEATGASEPKAAAPSPENAPAAPDADHLDLAPDADTSGSTDRLYVVPSPVNAERSVATPSVPAIQRDVTAPDDTRTA